MGEEMPLTPEDVSNKRFTPVRLREGYDMGEVDQFLDEVESELARLTKENDDLRSKLAAAQTGAPVAAPEPVVVEESEPEPVVVPEPVVEAPPVPAPAVAAPTETLRVETVADASNAAARLLEIATRNADEVVEDAKNQADRIVSEANSKASRVEAEAKVKADKLEQDARTRAQMLDAETAEKRKVVFGDLEKEQVRLTTEVDNLRAFEREYRSRLKSYFNQQLEALETAPEQAPAEVPAAQPKRLRSILGEEA